jgi:hypothetical protein
MHRKLLPVLVAALGAATVFAAQTKAQSPQPAPAVDKQAATAAPTPVADRAALLNNAGGHAATDTSGGAPAAAPGAIQALPTPKALLEKFESTSGGREVWSGFNTRLMKGIYQTEDGSGFAGIEILAKAPNKSLITITLGNGMVIREVCDGKSAWLEDPRGGAHEFTGAALESRIRQANFNDRATSLLLALTGKVVGTAQVGAHQTYVVEFASQKNITSKIYFDAASGLAVRADDDIRQGGTDYKVETYMDEYRLVDGALFPFRLRHVEKGNIFTVRLTQIKNNIPVEDSIFLKPESAAK